MAASPRRYLIALAVALSAGAGLGAELVPEGTPIDIDADYSEFDRLNNVIRFRGVQIRQGPVHIAADRAIASAIDFRDSNWTFEGNVRMGTGTANIEANLAVLSFSGHQLRVATITGTPAAFSHEIDGKRTEGHANRILYDFSKGVVRLMQNAWLSDGTNEISGESIQYDIEAQRVVAGGDGIDERVRITVVPKESSGSEDQTNE